MPAADLKDLFTPHYGTIKKSAGSALFYFVGWFSSIAAARAAADMTAAIAGLGRGQIADNGTADPADDGAFSAADQCAGAGADQSAADGAVGTVIFRTTTQCGDGQHSYENQTFLHFNLLWWAKNFSPKII
jgi:hypothetical protein